MNDDVRAAAVISLAFVLYKTPECVPQIVKLLLESFNPHVRYASCMAVGIAMAGTGDAQSRALLEPMLSDMTDFVRQGALLGSSMIYMQQGDACNGRKILQLREKLSSIIADKHQKLFWFPMMHMLSPALSPTVTIGLPPSMGADDEADAPEPFEWTPETN